MSKVDDLVRALHPIVGCGLCERELEHKCNDYTLAHCAVIAGLDLAASVVDDSEWPETNTGDLIRALVAK